MSWIWSEKRNENLSEIMKFDYVFRRIARRRRDFFWYYIASDEFFFIFHETWTQNYPSPPKMFLSVTKIFSYSSSSEIL